MNTCHYLICLILSQALLSAQHLLAQTPPPPVINTISTPPATSPISSPAGRTNAPTNKSPTEEIEKPGHYEEHQSICRKNEYDSPATLSPEQKNKRIEEIKNKIKTDPKQVRFKFQLLKEYLDQKDKSEATSYVNQLKNEGLDSANLVIATQALGVFEKSKLNFEKELLKITTENPKNIEALKFLAEIYKSQEKYSDVIAIYEDLTKITKVRYDEQLCEMYVLESYFKDAEQYCANAIKLNPKNPFPYAFLGVLFRETQKDQQAIESFKQSLRLGKTEMALVCLGELSTLKKDHKTAAEYYKQAQQVKPMSLRAIVGQAWAELYANKYIEALNSFKNSCAKDKKFLVEFRKAAKYLNEKKNAYAESFITEAQKCAEM